MSNILVLGIDAVAKKNLYQFASQSKFGYTFDVVSTNKSGRFRQIDVDEKIENVTIYALKNPIVRVAKIVAILCSRRYKHCELYAAGRIGFLYLILLKIFRVPTLLIERGDIGSLSSYSFLVRFSLNLSYRHVRYILYKEPYMKSILLEKINKRTKLIFLPNGVPIKKEETQIDKEITFLWANRIIQQRKFSWIVQASNEIKTEKDIRYALCGLKKNEIALYRKATNANISLHEYIDLEEFYKRSQFFLLPSTIVFGNYSLLEAMSYGVVPIVTKSIGLELIVRDDYNGIVTDFTYTSYKSGLEKALALSKNEYKRLSDNAKKTIEEMFSIEKYASDMNALYQLIHSENSR